MVTAELKRLPEAGEIVIVTVREVTGHGAYVKLDEYNGTTGFLHISEIATGWIRNIERYVRPKQKTVFESAHNLELTSDILKAIEEESNKIQVPHVEIRGIVEISLKKPDAIDIIKNILVQVETSKSNATVNVTYIGAPRYRVVVTA